MTMSDGSPKERKFSIKKVRKFFSIRNTNAKFPAGESLHEGNYPIKKSKIEKVSKDADQIGAAKMDLDHPQIIDVQNYSIFVATWNVAGKSPTKDLNIDDWLHASPPADIYVIGFQEIVPLNAVNILGAEDNGPAKKWLALIQKSLNNLPGSNGDGGSSYYTPSPALHPLVEVNADFEESSAHKSSNLFPRRSFQSNCSLRLKNDPLTCNPQLNHRFSFCEQAFLGHRSSDFGFGPTSRGPYRSSDCSRPSDCSRDEDSAMTDSPMLSPMPLASFHNGHGIGRCSRFSLVASKQMVGIFLCIWVRSDLKDSVRNMKISCVGRGLMGYLGNKGSISISMSLYQTSFCFICSHLTSGQNMGDELRRNSDFMEILKKTRFPRLNNGSSDDNSPETIIEHDRIIWLGDLNYRISLAYRSVKALVAMQDWRGLLENDQLLVEQRRGQVFAGWKEGNIYFPPTYKYSMNSDRYSGDSMNPKEKRRTPAWCDRILWYGKGIYQLSYARGESRFSDHRPVYGVFCAEVESNNNSRTGTLNKLVTKSSKFEMELLPYSNGYTELSFY